MKGGGRGRELTSGGWDRVSVTWSGVRQALEGPSEDGDMAGSQGHSCLRSPVAMVREAVGLCVGGGHMDMQVREVDGQGGVQREVSFV